MKQGQVSDWLDHSEGVNTMKQGQVSDWFDHSEAVKGLTP